MASATIHLDTGIYSYVVGQGESWEVIKRETDKSPLSTTFNYNGNTILAGNGSNGGKAGTYSPRSIGANSLDGNQGICQEGSSSKWVREWIPYYVWVKEGFFRGHWETRYKEIGYWQVSLFYTPRGGASVWRGFGAGGGARTNGGNGYFSMSVSSYD